MAGEVFSSLITSVNPNPMNAGSRNGIPIDTIILHHNATTNKDVAMNTWLLGGGAGTSAHYECTPTEIIGCVGEQYSAFHAGGTGGIDVPKIANPNQRSIGIENVNSSGAPNWSVDPRTITNCARLVADICTRYGIPCDRQHVLGHNEVTATACPGGMDVDEVVRQAQQFMAGGSNNAVKPEPSKPTPSKPSNNKNKEGVATMYCLYERPINSKTGVLEWNGDAWTVMFCNGVNCRRVSHPDEMKVIENIYRKNNGKDIPFYSQKEWNKNAPWYNRLETVCPVVGITKKS